jgi:hypothetical protein
VLRPGNHQIIRVEPERQRVIGTRAIDRDEGGILDRDGQLLERGDEPVLPVLVALEQAREGAHHCLAPDRLAFVIPRPVGGDPHLAVAALLRCPAFDRRQLALRNEVGNFRERQFGEIGGRFVRHRLGAAMPEQRGKVKGGGLKTGSPHGEPQGRLAARSDATVRSRERGDHTPKGG